MYKAVPNAIKSKKKKVKYVAQLLTNTAELSQKLS